MKTLIQTVAIAVATMAFSSCGAPTWPFLGAYHADGHVSYSSTTANTGSNISELMSFVEEGTDHELVLQDAHGCSIPFDVTDVTGGSATIHRGRQCLVFRDGTYFTFKFTAGSAARSGSSVFVQITGDWEANNGGPTVRGTFDQSMTLTKVGN